MAGQTPLNKTHKTESLDNTHRALLLNDKKLMLAASHVVLYQLVISSPRPWCLAHHLDWLHTIFRAAHAGDVPQSVLPDAARVPEEEQEQFTLCKTQYLKYFLFCYNLQFSRMIINISVVVAWKTWLCPPHKACQMFECHDHTTVCLYSKTRWKADAGCRKLLDVMTTDLWL